MNVVYASNDNYVRHLAVSMTSLMDRNQDMETMTVYVLSIGLSEENQNHLRSIGERYHRKVEMIELNDIESRFDHAVDTGGFDISVMSRLFIGQLLPDSVERVLYLDCDTVVAQPLDKLWKLDLKGKVLAAVMEPTIYDAVKEEIGLKAEDPYYNAGVLLIDLKRWRETEAEKRILDFYREKGGHLFANDQDTINGVLKDEILSMSPRYNFFTNYRYFSYENLLSHAGYYKAVTKERFTGAKRHPAIIHYMGDERPWIAGNLNHYRKAYEHYLAMTPWAGTPKEKGREWYMLAYHMMDYVTVLWPEVRWIISRKFGMKAVNARKQKTTSKENGNSKNSSQEKRSRK